MQLQFEGSEYPRRAIAAVVHAFDGQAENTFDNSNIFGIQANITDLTADVAPVKDYRADV